MTRPDVFRAVLLLCAFACLASASEAQQAQRGPEEYAKFLEGADRVARMQVPRVVSALELKPGMKVADIGSGSGLFTRPIARAVGPTGMAYAVDIDPALLKIVERSAADEQLGNVRTIHGAPADPKLPEPIDLAFVCDTLHHIDKPEAYLQTLKKYLTPDGRIAVIDFSDKWPQGHESMRYSLEELERWMRTAGMERVESHPWLDNSFFVVYRVRAEERSSGQRAVQLERFTAPLAHGIRRPYTSRTRRVAESAAAISRG